MRNRLRIALLLGVLLALAILVIFWFGFPKLLEVYPAEKSNNVAAGASVRLIFSRPLKTDALEAKLHFKPEASGTFEWNGSTLIFTPAQPWPAGVSVQVQLDPGIPAQGLLALPLRQGVTWSFLVRQPNIAFLYPSTDPANLYLLDPASGEKQQLTDSPGGVMDFTANPDGNIIYYSERKTPEGSTIYRLDLNNAASEQLEGQTAVSTAGQPEQVLACPQALCRGLALDSKENRLAYERSALPGGGTEMPQVWVLPLAPAGSQPFLVGDPAHQTVMPAWSARGLLAFYDSTAQAYLLVEPGGPERGRFPNQTGQQGAWRPDGEAFLAPEITYLNANVSPALSNLESLADSHLILFHLDSGQTEDLTPGEGIEDTSPAYSPNGEFLAFTRKYLDVKRWTPGRQLWIARVEGRETRQVTDSPLYNHYDLNWSPSGDQIAFVRFNQSALTEPPEIWMLDLLTDQTTRLVQGGYSPIWIP
jgi:Bacterial Ig-like domain/WD40-like Beta Propeller Repeat